MSDWDVSATETKTASFAKVVFFMAHILSIAILSSESSIETKAKPSFFSCFLLKA
jgi:hypothetical protein